MGFDTYGRKEREEDRAKANELELRASALKSEAKKDKVVAAAGLTGGLLAGGVFWGAVGAVGAGANYKSAEQKESLAYSYEQEAKELRDKADNAPYFKKKERE